MRNQVSSSPPEATSRRGLMRLVAAGGAGIAAALLSRNGTHAGHDLADGADVLHLERDNSTSARTKLESSSSEPTMTLRNTAGGNAIEVESDGQVMVMRLLGDSTNHTLQVEHDGVGGGAAVFARGHNTGVEAEAAGDGSGVWGRSVQGPGVSGESDSGPGVLGGGQGGPGVEGHSATGDGGVFSSDLGNALVANGLTRLEGDRDQFLLTIDNGSTGEVGGGILANSRGGKPTIEADVFPSEFNPGVGIQGVSYTGSSYEDGEFAEGAGIGVQGLSGDGAGVEGRSQRWFGVRGWSQAHVGVIGESVELTGVSGESVNYVGVYGQAANHTGIVGWGATGILATSHGGPSEDPASRTAGVAGAAPGDVPGVLAMSAFANPEIPKEPKVPDQVSGLVTDGGLALDVIGKARFTTAGNDAVAAGDNTRFVANLAVTGLSHISLTLHGDPGPRQLKWVERHPASGFTVHFAGGPPGQRPEVPFSYLIVEPAT